MKIAALIFGILAGLAGLPLASYAQVIVSFGGGQGGGAYYLLPTASFVGAGLALNFPAAAGGILAVCTVAWLGIGAQVGHAVNFITIGAVLFNGLGALFALIPFFQDISNREASGIAPEARGNTLDSLLYTQRPNTSPAPTYDRVKWNALVKYDPEIGRLADKIRQLGDKWVDVLAADYLALNDKSYLPEIVRKIIEEARKEEQEAARLRDEGEKKATLLLAERERLAEIRREKQAQRLHARRQQIKTIRDDLFHSNARWVLIAFAMMVIIGGVYEA